MIRYILTSFCCFIFPALLYAQNLVPNPSFEDTLGCPDNANEIYLAKGWSSYGETPDYFNGCSSTLGLNYQQPADGKAYCGFYSYNEWSGKNYREFIGRKLSDQLIIGNKYFVSIKISLAEISNCATNGIGVLFSTIPYSEANPIPINNYSNIYSENILNDSLGWVIVSGSIIADSAYNYIVIGNSFQDSVTKKTLFRENQCNAYYFVDDICISPDSASCELNSNVNLQEKKNVSVYPNPANKKISISLDGIGECSVTNILGQEVKSILIYNREVIDIYSLQEGTYFLKIKHNNTFTILKQIIIHH